VVRLTLDVTHGFERTMTLTQPDAVSQAVRDWLDEVVAGEKPHD
jgi:hypothetical protein